MHPCYPSGYNISMLAEDIFGSECTNKDIPLWYSPKKTITFFGQSKPGQCKDLVRGIFDLTSCQGAENCSFDGVYQPTLSGDFMVGIFSLVKIKLATVSSKMQIRSLFNQLLYHSKPVCHTVCVKLRSWRLTAHCPAVLSPWEFRVVFEIAPILSFTIP